jgi:hypothetical protein
MLYVHPDLDKRMEDRRRAEARHQAETWRLLRQVKANQPGWFVRRGCWVLCQVGHLLIRLGQQLEQYGPLHAEPGTGRAQ